MKALFVDPKGQRIVCQPLVQECGQLADRPEAVPAAEADGQRGARLTGTVLAQGSDDVILGIGSTK